MGLNTILDPASSFFRGLVPRLVRCHLSLQTLGPFGEVLLVFGHIHLHHSVVPRTLESLVFLAVAASLWATSTAATAWAAATR